MKIDAGSKTIHGLIRVFLLGAALAIGSAGCGGGTAPPGHAVPPADQQAVLAERIDAVLAREQSTAAPGLSILIVKDEQVLYSRNKGLAREPERLAVNERTAFDVASISKPITAIGIVQLRERGVLSFTDSVLRWIPELPPSWSSITIGHLLSQQSGIPDYMIGLPLDQAFILDGFSNASLLRRFADNPALNFAPGSKGEYVNSNYVLLAEVLARASGMTYPRYIREHVFQPAGMQSSFMFDEAVPPATDVALNFARSRETFGVNLATYGATGIFSTTNDIRLLASALSNGKLVSMESLNLMTQPQSPYLIQENRYGYGFFLPQQGRAIFFHRGQLDGFRSLLRVNRDKKTYIIVLGNGGKPTDGIIDAVLTVALQTIES